MVLSKRLSVCDCEAVAASDSWSKSWGSCYCLFAGI